MFERATWELTAMMRGMMALMVATVCLSCRSEAVQEGLVPSSTVQIPRVPQIDPLSRNFLGPFMEDFFSPTDAGFKVEEVRITNVGGESLRAWFLPKEGATHTVMFCMGNTGNISCMLMYARILLDGGYNVLLFDYQGFGGSTGTATAMSLLSDSLSAHDYLTQTRGLDPKSIGIFGVSLGSALAIAVAVERDVAAVAVEDVLLPNQKIEEMRSQLPNDLPTQLAISAVQTLVIPRVDPIVNVPKLKCPLFLMHGERDRLLLPSGSIEVARLSRVPTRLWLIDNAGHAPETLEVNDREYASQIQRFFRDAFAGTMTDPKVAFSATGSDNDWSTAVQFESPGRAAWQICLSAPGGRRHHFERRVVDGDFGESIKTAFKPEYVSVVSIEHVQPEPDDKWTPELSKLSQQLADFRTFETAAWGNLVDNYPLTFTPSGFFHISRPSQQRWSVIREKLPKPQDVNPRVRPRYGELLAHLYAQLSVDEQDETIEMLDAARTYLPDEPDEYYQLDNAGFRVGAKQQPWAFWTLVALARSRHRNGQLEEARSMLQQALPYSTRTEFTAERIGGLEADAEFFSAIGFENLGRSIRNSRPLTFQRGLDP